jgi:hypothetical protein
MEHLFCTLHLHVLQLIFISTNGQDACIWLRLGVFLTLASEHVENACLMAARTVQDDYKLVTIMCRWRVSFGLALFAQQLTGCLTSDHRCVLSDSPWDPRRVQT